MNKSLTKAFTLIELIVVISIMTLITAWSVFYFIDFVKNRELSQKLQIIEDDFIKLDNDVKKYNTFDYEINLNTSSLSWWYITYLNNFDIKYYQRLENFNTNNFNWNITISWENTAYTWTLKLYKKYKLFLNEEIQYWSNIAFSFNTDPYYKIKSTLSWEILNEIDLHYFSEDNVSIKKNNIVNLIRIEPIWWTDIEELTIKNIGWTKEFYNWWTKLSENEINLYFENNWIEQFITITK